MVPSLQDKDSIFALALNPKNFYELQKKIQVMLTKTLYLFEVDFNFFFFIQKWFIWSQ